MKRILSVCLTLILTLFAAVSCGDKTEPVNDPVTDRQAVWEFEVSAEKDSVTAGEPISITVKVTNVGEDYHYVGSPVDLFGEAELYLENNKSFTMSHLPFANTDDATARIFEAGESVSYTYEFTSDEESKEGLYSLEVPFDTVTEVFKNIIVLEKPTSDEEKAVIELANAEIMKKYPIKSFDAYTISVDREAWNGYSLRYELNIGKYRTGESYIVLLNADKTLREMYGDYGEYAVYLPYATADKIHEAEEKLKKQLERYDETGGFFLSIDKEGYLVLTAEVIVYFDETFTGEGAACGDHDHLFFRERICGKE